MSWESSPLKSSLSGAKYCDDLANGATDLYCVQMDDGTESTGPLTLARFCTQRLNLQLRVVVMDHERLQIRISNIKCV